MRSPRSSSLEGVFRVDGKVGIDEVNELLDVELPDEEWDTVGGLVLELLGQHPGRGAGGRLRNLVFTAEQVRGRRIAKVLHHQARARGGGREEEQEVGAG